MYVYDYVERLVLTARQKQLLLVRFTIIMDKVKRKLGVYSACHTCTGTLLIVGNIMVPSLLSVEAFLFDLEDMRRVVFWIVWVLSVVIALVSSFVTFCNTQKKYNLYNQFNTKIRRELWSYLTLSGRYMVLEQHLRLLGRRTSERSDYSEIRFDLDGGEEETEEEEESGEKDLNCGGGEETKATSGEEDFQVPADLFEDVPFFNVDDVPSIMNRGHMLHFHSFLNRMETLYRFLTNSNIDIEVEDMSNIDQRPPPPSSTRLMKAAVNYI